MRLVRLFAFLAALLMAALVVAPGAAADAPFRLPTYVTDNAGALDPAGRAEVESAVNKLYNDHRVQLWVVYVDSFDGQDPVQWARATMRISDLTGADALLAVAIKDQAYAFQVRDAVTTVTQSDVTRIQQDDIGPALRSQNWAGAAVAAANGLDNSGSSGESWVTFVVILLVIGLAVVVLILVMRRRRGQRRKAEIDRANRLDPADPAQLASVSVEALDELSKAKVVEVDNAVRTSENELALAIEEFGPARTEPFTRAVNNAKATLAQAFNVRHQLDDAIPETPGQRRDLLTRVIVAAVNADRELEAQSEAFAKLRDLVINAPAKLDTLTQKLVELTARVTPSEQKMSVLHSEFDEAALVSIAGNVTTAQERLAFADQNITQARAQAARPVAGQQSELVDTVRAAEAALGQAKSLLDAVDSAESDIRRATATLPSAIADIQAGIAHADDQLRRGDQGELAAARSAAAQALNVAQTSGATDPLGAFTQLTKADADLDRLLAAVEEQREAAERLNRAYDQALFTAQSRVRAVSDYIDARRGSIGPEARTRLAEAARQLEAAQAKRPTEVAEAIAHANGASHLAAQAQQLANTDAQYAQQRAYGGNYGGGGSNMGAVLGGIIVGNILSGAMRGGGDWNSTGFGGSGGGFGGGDGGGGGFMGGGGRF